VKLDHLAFAVKDAQPVIDLMAARFGATPLFGARDIRGRFRAVVVRMGDAARGAVEQFHVQSCRV